MTKLLFFAQGGERLDEEELWTTVAGLLKPQGYVIMRNAESWDVCIFKEKPSEQDIAVALCGEYWKEEDPEDVAATKEQVAGFEEL